MNPPYILAFTFEKYQLTSIPNYGVSEILHKGIYSGVGSFRYTRRILPLVGCRIKWSHDPADKTESCDTHTGVDKQAAVYLLQPRPVQSRKCPKNFELALQITVSSVK